MDVCRFFYYVVICMDKTESSVTVTIQKIVAHFLEEQLGEKAKSITTFQFRNKIVVYAEGCYTPAEDDLVNNEKHSNLLRELKYKEFEQVKPLFKDRLEKTLGLTIIRIKSLIGPRGDRVQYITFSKKVRQVSVSSGIYFSPKNGIENSPVCGKNVLH